MSQPFKMRDIIFLPDFDERFPDHTWVFWASPSVTTLKALSSPFMKGDEKIHEDEEAAYFVAVSECVFDTGESGYDMSTPEKAREIFFGNDAAIVGLLGGIVAHYVEYIYRRLESYQKKMRERSSNFDTGNGSKAKESVSPT